MAARDVTPMDCNTCCGPVIGRSDLQIDLSHIAYWVWMRLPDWLAFSRLGFVILPYSGNIAFTCSCRDKNAAVIRARLGLEEHRYV
jgi:hypothetical protein